MKNHDLHVPGRLLAIGVGDIIEKIIDSRYISIFITYQQIIVIEKNRFGNYRKIIVIENVQLISSDNYCSMYPFHRHNLPPTLEIIIKFSNIFQSQHREFQNLWEVHRQSQVQK